MAIYVNTLRANGKSHAVTIPPAVLRALHWNRGDVLLMEIAPDGVLVVHPEKKMQEFLKARAAQRVQP